MGDNEPGDSGEAVTATLESRDEPEVLAERRRRKSDRAQDCPVEEDVVPGHRSAPLQRAEGDAGKTGDDRRIAIRESDPANRGVSGEGGDTAREPIWWEGDVGIDEADEATARRSDPGTASESSADVCRQPEESDAWVSGGKLRDDLGGCIRRAIVDDDHFKRGGIDLSEDGAERRFNPRRLAVSDDDERDHRAHWPPPSSFR